MNGDDERDYAEEADVRAVAVREGLAEQAAERAQLVDGHMSGPAHYLEAERLRTRTIEFVRAETAKPLSHDEMVSLFAQAMVFLAAAQIDATLALAAAVAEIDVVGRNDGTGRDMHAARAWTAVLR